MSRCPDRLGQSRLTFTLAAILAIPPLAVQAAPAYLSITPVTGKYASAVALNDAGRYAVNNFGPEIQVESAYISGSPLLENVGSLGGYITRIRSINNQGQAVGTSTTADGTLHAFLYTSGRMRDLTAAYGIGSVNVINDRGEITGQTRDERAMVIRNGQVDAFGPPHSVAGDINGAGAILVEQYPEGDGIRTSVYSQGRFTDLPTLGGAYVTASAINDAGWVSGYGATADGRPHAWLYDGRTMADLTPSAANGAAYDINNLGHVVGVMDNRAFLYADSRLVDLNSLLDPGADLLLTSAFAINNRDQILAKACDRAGVFCYETVLLGGIPAVPEPAGVMMMLAGIGALGAWWGVSCVAASGHAIPQGEPCRSSVPTLSSWER